VYITEEGLWEKIRGEKRTRHTSNISFSLASDSTTRLSWNTKGGRVCYRYVTIHQLRKRWRHRTPPLFFPPSVANSKSAGKIEFSTRTRRRKIINRRAPNKTTTTGNQNVEPALSLFQRKEVITCSSVFMEKTYDAPRYKCDKRNDDRTHRVVGHDFNACQAVGLKFHGCHRPVLKAHSI